MEIRCGGLGKVEKKEINKSNGVFQSLLEAKLSHATEIFSSECQPTGTEGHHAGHVLTFLSYMAYNAARGKGIRQRLLKRVIHHLTALQEFIENPELSSLVKSMIESIHTQYGKYPEDCELSAEAVSLWLAGDQENILRLAECYGKRPVFDGLLPIKIPIVSKGVIGTAIHDRSGCHPVGGERHLAMLFRDYFNNKMALLVFLARAESFRLNEKSAQLACGFLDDMYRHMLPEGSRKKYRLVFLWLKKFFLKLPDVTIEQRKKASEFIRSIYEISGIYLNEGGRA